MARLGPRGTSTGASGSGEAGARQHMGAVSKQGSFRSGDLGKSYQKGKTGPSCRLQLVLSSRGGDVWSFHGLHRDAVFVWTQITL